MKQVIFTILMLTCILPAGAQSKIQSVFGVSLGATKASVEASLTRQGYKFIEGQTSKEKFPYLQIKSPVLGDCKFERASFVFENGTLSKVTFFSFDGCSADPNFEGPNNGYQRALANGEKYKRIFDLMRMNLCDKYGKPAINSDEKCVWRSGNNQISLEYTFKDEPWSGSWREVEARVAVTYGKRQSSNY